MFLGPRGPLGTPLSVRPSVSPSVRPQEKSKSLPKPFKSSKDPARLLKWNIDVKRTMYSIIQWFQIQWQRQLQWQRQWQRQKKFQEEWVNVFRFKFPLWMFIGWLRCPLLMTMFTSIQRQRQRQRQIQGQRQSQSSENTRHRLYFRKAEGARIPNMIFLSWWRRQGLGRPGGQGRQGGQRG